MIRYESDHTVGHREYWRAILAAVRAEMKAEEEANLNRADSTLNTEATSDERNPQTKT